MLPHGGYLRGRSVPRSCGTGNVLPAGMIRRRSSRRLCRLFPPGGPGIRLPAFLSGRALDRGFHPLAGRHSVCGCFRGRYNSCRTGRTASPSAASGCSRGWPADGIAPRVGLPAVVKVVGKDSHRTETARAVSARTLQGVTPSAAETTASSKAAARGPDGPARAAAKGSRSSAAGGCRAAFSFAAGDIRSRPAHAGGNRGLHS